MFVSRESFKLGVSSGRPVVGSFVSSASAATWSGPLNVGTYAHEIQRDTDVRNPCTRTPSWHTKLTASRSPHGC
jgi:hypothetical protein